MVESNTPPLKVSPGNPLPPEPAPLAPPPEFGGPKGPEPTRFGDWEQKGRCTDV